MTRRASYPDIAELMPHSGRMRLLSRVLEHTAERTRCAVEVDASELFRDPDGAVPGWVGLEYMAQCVAAHAGLVARHLGWPVERGLFLGTRRTDLFVDRFEAGSRLEVEATHLRGDQGLLWFECALRTADAAPNRELARGRLSVYAMAQGETRDAD